MTKKLLTIIIAVLLVAATVAWEAVGTQTAPVATDQLLQFPESDQFTIRTDDNNQWHQRQRGETPRYVRLAKTAVFNYNGGNQVAAPADTIYKIVALNQQLTHLKLITGGLLLDHRFQSSPIFVQADRIGIWAEPFSQALITHLNGQTTIQAITGHQQVLINTGEEQVSHYLTAGQQISIATDAITPDWGQLSFTEVASRLSKRRFSEPNPLANIYKFNINAYLRQNTAYEVTYKRKTNYLPFQFLERIIINPTRRNLAKITELSQILNAARELLFTNQQQQATENLANFNQLVRELVAEDPQVLRPALKYWLQVYGSIPANSVYQPIKQEVVASANLTFTQNQLTQTWTYAIDSLPTWQQVKGYFNVIATQAQTTENLASLYNLKARLLYQFRAFPAKNELQAYQLLENINQAILAQVDQQEQLATVLTLEQVLLIRQLSQFQARDTLSASQIVEPITFLLQKLEAYHAQSSIDTNYQDYLEQELPGINQLIQRAESA